MVNLPTVQEHPHKSLVIRYKNGEQLVVPYIDRGAALLFLSMEEDDIESVELVPYSHELTKGN